MTRNTNDRSNAFYVYTYVYSYMYMLEIYIDICINFGIEKYECLSRKFGKNREKVVFKRITGFERLTIFALALLDQSLVFNILVAYFAIEPRSGKKRAKKKHIITRTGCKLR